MQYPNNDMDELFRRAAEAYPLNTSSANWDKVHAMLADTGEVKKKQLSKGRFLWLLVLLPLVLIGLPLNDTFFTSQLQATTRSQTPAPEATPQQRAGRAGVTKPATILERSRSGNFDPPMLRRQPALKPLPLQPLRLPSVQQREETVSGEHKPGNFNPALTPAVAENAIALHELNKQNPGLVEPLVPATEPGSPADRLLIDSSNKELAETNTPNKAKPGSPKKRFYAGVLAGPDISTVKFQKFSNVGFQAGVLLGYALNDRLAVEAGALSSQKHYFSDGEYYKPKGFYLPPNSEILSVTGNCRMIELPVALRYTFSQQKKHSWFASAGLSSYLMQRENYSMDYLYRSSGTVATYHRSYNDKEQYWLSSLQVSVGYTSKVGTVGNLRIEPYYALPLKGMGHGRLPVSSLGIRFGFTMPQFGAKLK